MSESTNTEKLPLASGHGSECKECRRVKNLAADNLTKYFTQIDVLTAENKRLRAKLEEWIKPCFCTDTTGPCLMCETRELLAVTQNADFRQPETGEKTNANE